jgi:hypothetical protein
MSGKQLMYQAYLLRLWRDHAGAPWRATLIDAARTNQQRHFASLDALLAFLMAQADPATPPGDQHASQPSEWARAHCIHDEL